METSDMTFQVAVFDKETAIFTLGLKLIDNLFIGMHPEIVLLEALGQKLPITYVALHFSVFNFVKRSVEAPDVVGQRFGVQHLEAPLTGDSKVFLIVNRGILVVDMVMHY
jgi:hypothetical protein